MLWRPAAIIAKDKFPDDEKKQQEFIDKYLKKTLNKNNIKNLWSFLKNFP